MEVFREVIQCMRVGKTKGGKRHKCHPLDFDNYCFPTPETCRNPDNLPTLRRKTFDSITELQKHDFLDLLNNKQDKKTFLA